MEFKFSTNTYPTLNQTTVHATMQIPGCLSPEAAAAILLDTKNRLEEAANDFE